MLKDQPFVLQGSLAEEAAARPILTVPGGPGKLLRFSCLRKAVMWSRFSKCTDFLQAILGVSVPQTLCWGTLVTESDSKVFGRKMGFLIK